MDEIIKIVGIGLIAVVLIKALLPVALLKYITAICVFFIMHILFILLESVSQMYLTFWSEKQKTAAGITPCRRCIYTV